MIEWARVFPADNFCHILLSAVRVVCNSLTANKKQIHNIIQTGKEAYLQILYKVNKDWAQVLCFQDIALLRLNNETTLKLKKEKKNNEQSCPERIDTSY